MDVANGSMNKILATCLTNYHVAFAKEELSRSLEELHLSTNEELIKEYRLAMGSSAVTRSDAVLATGAGLSAPMEALRTLQIVGTIPAERSELEKADLDNAYHDKHVGMMLRIITHMLNRVPKQLYAPGLENARKWIHDNYTFEKIASTGVNKMVAKSEFKTNPALVLELEVLRVIALYPFEARQNGKVVDVIDRIGTVLFVKRIYESIEKIKDCDNFSANGKRSSTTNRETASRTEAIHGRSPEAPGCWPGLLSPPSMDVGKRCHDALARVGLIWLHNIYRATSRNGDAACIYIMQHARKSGCMRYPFSRGYATSSRWQSFVSLDRQASLSAVSTVSLVAG